MVEAIPSVACIFMVDLTTACPQMYLIRKMLDIVEISPPQWLGINFLHVLMAPCLQILRTICCKYGPFILWAIDNCFPHKHICRSSGAAHPQVRATLGQYKALVPPLSNLFKALLDIKPVVMLIHLVSKQSCEIISINLSINISREVCFYYNSNSNSRTLLEK